MQKSRTVLGAAALAGAALAGAAPALLSAAVGVISARPRLAARLFGSDDHPSRHPSDLGMQAVDVEYRAGCRAWWIAADEPVGSVVIVHGFEPTDNPLKDVNVTRPDVVTPCLSQDEALDAAPKAEDGRFAVPRILGESE